MGASRARCVTLAGRPGLPCQDIPPAESRSVRAAAPLPPCSAAPAWPPRCCLPASCRPRRGVVGGGGWRRAAQPPHRLPQPPPGAAGVLPADPLAAARRRSCKRWAKIPSRCDAGLRAVWLKKSPPPPFFFLPWTALRPSAFPGRGHPTAPRQASRQGRREEAAA